MIRPLSIVWNFDPVFFSIGSLDIRYYGLMWALAILIGAKFFDNFCKREGLPPKVSESIFIYGTLATIIGARLGHCLFYDPMEYLSKPWTIITGFRDGGMASHGAAIGLLIGLWLFSRKNKLPYIWSLDRIMIAVGIGGAVVRLGNLFNSEIFGMATTLPWGFEFVRSAKWVNEFAPAAVHPTQIYEALCYLITFGILCWLYYAKDIARRRPGILFGIGLLGIFLTRFFIEFIKTEQEAFEQGWVLDMGQWLSIPFIVLGIYMIYRGASAAGSFPAPVPKAPAATAKKEETMSNYPMVDEVNRLVGNLLAAGSGVFLPGVGSLFVERRGARRLSKRTVLPPCRVVSFSSQQQGVSLADELARTLHCDAAGAQDVYDRWLSRTREGDVLTIEGVGVLKFKTFYARTRVRQAAEPAGTRARADQACPPVGLGAVGRHRGDRDCGGFRRCRIPAHQFFRYSGTRCGRRSCAHLARRGCGDSRRFVRDGRCDGRRDCDGSCGNEGCGNRRCREQCCGGGRDGG